MENAVLQEMSVANVFLVVKNDEIVTLPPDRGTILPGIPRESVIAIIQKFSTEIVSSSDIKITERDVTVGDFKNASKAFCTGIAAELVPIARLATYKGEEEFEVVFPHGTKEAGPVTSKLLWLLQKVMYGKLVVDEAWLRDPYLTTAKFGSSTNGVKRGKRAITSGSCILQNSYRHCPVCETSKLSC